MAWEESKLENLQGPETDSLINDIDSNLAIIRAALVQHKKDYKDISAAASMQIGVNFKYSGKNQAVEVITTVNNSLPKKPAKSVTAFFDEKFDGTESLFVNVGFKETNPHQTNFIDKLQEQEQGQDS